jgi:uncharacterized delta-60 repeat protein
MKSLRFVWIFLGVLLTSARAYDAWTTIPQSATTQNLWSIAFGNRTLVACGEQGTLLTFDYSAVGDELAWQPQASGTDAWLVGAGYGNGRFIVVGDRGVILTSDDKGATWTRRSSGTSTRLNAVAYGNGWWIAVGEQGVVLVSSDGITWAARPALGTGFLRALAFGQGKFLIGGAGGALFSTSDGSNFAPVAISTTANIEGVALSPGHVFLVGSNGLRASMTPAGAWAFGAPRTETFRGVAVRNSEEASAVGELASDTFVSLPTGGNWVGNFASIQFLGTAVVQGENEMVSVGFAGNIARTRMETLPFIVSDAPVIYGHDAHFNVITGTSGAIQWTFNGADVPGATQSTYVIPSVTPAKVGAVGVRVAGLGTIGGSSFSVVPGGQPEVRDPTFVSALPVVPSVIGPQSDGKILVAGTFTVTINNGPVYGLARLNADGSLDQAFRPGTGLSAGTSIAALHVMADGRIYVRGSFTSIAGQARAGLARLLANGAIDPSFVPDPALAAEAVAYSAVTPDGKLLVQTAVTGTGGGVLRRLNLDGTLDAGFAAPTGSYRLIGVDSRGRVLAAQYGSNITAPATLLRLLASGAPDPAYTTTVVTLAGLYGYDLIDPVVTDAGLYAKSRQGRISVTTSYVRYKPDGGLDSSYISPPSHNDLAVNSVYRPDGGVWFVSPAGSSLYTATFYGPTGALDPSVYATLIDKSNFRIVAFLPDGAFLATRGATQTTLIKIRPLSGRIGQLTNLSVRAGVTGDPLIAGFVTLGSGTIPAITRAIGPGLVPFSVVDAVRDPLLQLVRDGATVELNDNWPASLAPRFASVGAFALPAGSKDAALESEITAGNYSAVFTAPANDTGTGLVELYQATASLPTSRRFVNVSARATVDAAHPLIAGFTITGDVPLKVLIRAAGPTLGAVPFNLAQVMADPQLLLYQGGTALWENDNWTNDLAEPARRAGAFPFATGSKDGAMLVTLAPGSYTAVVSGVNGAGGTALVEVYEAP